VLALKAGHLTSGAAPFISCMKYKVRFAQPKYSNERLSNPVVEQFYGPATTADFTVFEDALPPDEAHTLETMLR